MIGSSKQPKLQVNKTKQQQQKNSKVKWQVQQRLPENYIFLYWESIHPISNVWLVVSFEHRGRLGGLKSLLVAKQSEDTPFELSLLLTNYRRRFQEKRAAARALRAAPLRAGASAARLFKF